MATERVSVNFDANTAGLQTGVNRAKGMLGGLGDTARGIGGKIAGFLSAGLVANYITGVIAKFDRIGDLAKRFDTNTDSIQRLGYVSEQSGADLELMASGLQKAAIAGQKAEGGSKQIAAAFKDLGISVKDFNAATPEEKLAMIADGFAASKDEGKALAAVIAIMGRSAGELIPLLREGGDEMRKAMGEASIATEESIANIQKLDDAWMKLKGTIAAATANALAFFMTGPRDRSQNDAPSVASLGLTERARNAQVSSTLALLYSAQARKRIEAEGRQPFSEGQAANEKAINDLMSGETYGPANAAGEEEFQRLANAKRYYQFLESKKAVNAGIAAVDQQLAGMSPTNPVVASSLASIGGGGNVFGGGDNKAYGELVKHRKILETQVTKFDEMIANTKNGVLMP